LTDLRSIAQPDPNVPGTPPVSVTRSTAMRRVAPAPPRNAAEGSRSNAKKPWRSSPVAPSLARAGRRRTGLVTICAAVAVDVARRDAHASGEGRRIRKA
jgi:hypothetical protein